jgi:hypothetical protein
MTPTAPTCHAVGVTKLAARLQLSVTTAPLTLSPVPSFVHSVLVDPHWCHAMEEEYETVLPNSMWDLVPQPPGVNVVTSK